MTQENHNLTDLTKIIAAVWQKRWLLITSVALFGGGFGMAAFMMHPIYSSSTIIIAANSDHRSTGALSSVLGQLGGLASLAGAGLGSGDAETTEALAIMHSREFIEKFIDELNLLPELFPDKWDSTISKWKVDETKQPTLSKGYKYFTREVLTISQDKKTSLVTIEIRWTDRLKAAAWANELITRINQTMRTRAIVNSVASVGYLEKELRETNVVATQDAINRLIEAQIKQRMLANVTPEYAFRIVDRAMPADKDEPIFPRKFLLLMLGAVSGLIVGVSVILLFPGSLFRKSAND